MVTGASSGTGRSFAVRLASEGFNLIITARRTDRLENLKQQLEEEYKVKVIVHQFDLLAPTKEAWDSIETLFINNNVTVLINNAGTTLRCKAPFGEVPLQDCHDVVEVNVQSLLHLTHQFLRHLDESHHLIVFMSSCTAMYCSPYNSTYAATKGFIRQFSKSVAFEYDNVDCTVFTPWHMSTEMIGNAPPRINICTADQFVDCALLHVGLEKEIDPYWGHYFEDWVWRFVPASITSSMLKKEFKNFKKMRDAMEKKGE
ncbi:Estradiol 17-beta-dehydrogenase [Entamoeba marina]